VKRSSLLFPHGVRTRQSKNAAATPAAYGVLDGPPIWPAAREKPWMWRTRARRDRRPYGGRTAMPRPNNRRQRRRRRQGHPGQEPGTRQLSAPTPGRPHGAEVHLLHMVGEPLSSPRMLEEEAGYWPMWEAEPRLGSPSAPARMMNILEAEGRREAAARLASPHHEAGGHPSGWPQSGDCSRAA
jgi:hypothetical protein